MRGLHELSKPPHLTSPPSGGEELEGRKMPANSDFPCSCCRTCLARTAAPLPAGRGAGFDSIGLADHLVDWAGGKGPWFELWSQLSAIAQATTRIRLTTLVAQIPLRNPALLALQALTADHISGGRLDVGLGIGLEVDPAYRMMGIENWSAKERVARFGEYVEIVDRLLSQEETSFQGRFYKVNAAALRPRPVQSPRPPIVIAAMGPVMLGHAARHADIWNSISFAKTFEAQLNETRSAWRQSTRVAPRSGVTRRRCGAPISCSTRPPVRAAARSSTTSPRKHPGKWWSR